MGPPSIPIGFPRPIVDDGGVGHAQGVGDHRRIAGFTEHLDRQRPDCGVVALVACAAGAPMGGVVVVHPGVEPLSGGIPEPSHRCGGGAELVEERHRPFSLLLCVTCHADSNLGPNPVQLFVRTPGFN